MDRSGQVSIVTGGASGIGLALARALAARGVRVLVADIDVDGAQAAAAELGELGEAAELDVREAPAVQALVAATHARHGRLDLMFNNAGIAITGDARDLEIEHWRRVLDVNLMGVIYGSDAAYKLMAQQGFGHIVNIASLAGLAPFPSNAPYATAKHAVVGLSQSLRVEGEDLGVRVSVVCPGFVESNIYQATEAVNLPRERIADPSFSKLPAQAAAALILRGVDANRGLIVFPAAARLMWRLHRLNAAITARIARRFIRELRAVRKT